MRFEIPTIKWSAQNETCFDGHARETHISKNTFCEYAIQVEKHSFYCYYGNGRFKQFISLGDAKEWVETVHYPSQVQKYFKIIDRAGD
ncbi:hypothetical protein [Moraxella ovis]|uniref:hypothetical protein n=1 Tax=Moraxella ovis TaxID=29433 RepID=UPI000D8E112B|nr:hypothetical protein [Moraxella ovis]SPX85359.1 Uncharacterised protein [Moraxella ovis]STZ06338.1 Uncharacterised protein [Moraxella ovis]